MNQTKKNRRRQQQQQLHRRRPRQKPSRQPARIVIPVPLVRTAAMTLLLALSMTVLLSSCIETTTATTTTTTTSSSSSSTAVLAFACSRIRPTGRAPRGIVATSAAAAAAATAATRRGRGASFLPATREGRPPPISDDGDSDGNGNEGSSSSSRIRRDVLQSIVPTAFFAASSAAAAAAAPTAAAATAATAVQPLVDVAMVRLKLPGGGLGEDYVAMPVYVNGHGPYEFMLDTGLTTEFVTPRLVRREHLLDSDDPGKAATPIRGLAAGGTPSGQTLIELKDVVALPSSKDGIRPVPLSTLHAVITDFPQEHIDPKHDPVEGMVGMELLSQYDVDLDFQHQRIRLYPPGTVVDSILQDESDRNKYVVVPAVVINETGLIGIRLNVPGRRQPVLAFLDCGSSFTCLNWKAAHYLGFPAERDTKAYADQPRIAAIGIDGRPIVLPTYPQSFTYSGDAVASPTDPKQLVGFEAPPPAWEPWRSVQVAIGDIPAFQTVLGDGITPYQGPAALVGLDVLTQKRRFVLEGTSPNNPTRKRRILISTT